TGLDANRAQSPLGPAAIVDCVIRLHRSDHAELAKARNICGNQMLRVLDSESTVARAILLRDLFKICERNIVSPITNRMNRTLEARLIGVCDILLQFSFRDVVPNHQPRSVRRILEWFEEQGRG